MLEILLISCLLIWFPVLLYQINHRGFLVLLIWLLIAPVASSVVRHPGANPFFKPPEQQEEVRTGERRTKGLGYLKAEANIRMNELLEPTRLLFGLFVILFMVNNILQRKTLITVDRTETLMVVFLLVLVTNVLLQSRRLEFGLRIAIDAFTVPFLGYFIARRLIINEDRFMKLSQVIGYMGVYLIIIGLIERLMYTRLTYRLRGPFDYRDALYIVIMVAFFIVLVDYISTNPQRQKFGPSRGIGRFVLGLAPIIILFIWTRGVWLGFLTGIWTFALLGRTLISKRRKLLVVGLVFSLFPIVFLGLQELMTIEDFSRRVTDPGNLYGRLATYRIIVKELDSNPLFGIGLNNLRDTLAEKKVLLFGKKSYMFSHNSYLALLVECGIIGFLAYLAMAWSILRMGVRLFRRGMHPKDQWRGIGLIAVMVAYLIPPLFDSTLYAPYVSHVYVFVFSGALAGVYDTCRAVDRIKPDWMTTINPSVLTHRVELRESPPTPVSGSS